MENSSDNNNNNMNMVSVISREKLDQVATWVSSTVLSAFFSSLERCSCVNLTTIDPDDDEDEANDRPLTLTAPQPQDDIV